MFHKIVGDYVEAEKREENMKIIFNALHNKTMLDNNQTQINSTL